MLPPAHRMRRATDFTDTLRRGPRARRGSVVVHHLTCSSGPDGGPSDVRPDAPALVGLVVGRAVGNAVVRHRVSRRLRAQLAARVHRLPPGSRTVVRALPEAATADSMSLGGDLDAAFERLQRLERVPGSRAPATS